MAFGLGLRAAKAEAAANAAASADKENAAPSNRGPLNEMSPAARPRE